jgi:AcrR family transcriptional regulator
MRPPPGRQRLSREFIARHQRARIVAALAEESMVRGYRAVTVADIVRRAGIARNTFYDNFSSKEDCFLAAQEQATRESLQRFAEAEAEGEDWAARLIAGLGAFLGYVSEEPALARICIVEALSAGPVAQDRYERSLQEFATLLRRGRERSPHGDEDLPETLEEAIVGGVFWVIYRRIVLGEVERVAALLPELANLVLTPYIGAESAQRAVARR